MTSTCIWYLPSWRSKALQGAYQVRTVVIRATQCRNRCLYTPCPRPGPSVGREGVAPGVVRLVAGFLGRRSATLSVSQALLREVCALMSHPGSSPPPVALAWLERAGDRRYVESETRIGRGEQNNFLLTDASISRDHALIRRVEGEYVLSDLDSSNGTFVNDERVYEPRRLAPGDRVRLANVEFAFHLDQPALTSTRDHLDRPLATSISQFLTISAQIETQNYLEGDLRVVTVLFLDLCGFTALSERMSPEQITVVVNQCFQHLTETATRFGGFVDKYIGDAMMVLFGAPQAHQDDAERGVRAAIAMQERLAAFSKRLKRRSGIELQMRVGINTGEVLAGAIGSGQFSAYTVMGDTVNLASRLEEHARVGHILVSETTVQYTRHLVRYSASTPTNIRGKHELVNAYEVEGLATDGEPAEAVRFVGRQAQMADIESLFDDKSGGRLAFVCGPVGSGKSRLIEELRRRHDQEAEFVVVRCPDLVESGLVLTANSLVQQLQRKLAGRRGPEAHRELPTLTGEPDDAPPAPPRDEQVDTAAASIGSLLQELARERSVVMVFDRADLAEPTTSRLLEGLVAAIQTSDVLLLALVRSRPSGVWQSHLVELPPLSNAESQELIEVLLQGKNVEAATLDRLIGWSGGWPGVLAELIRVAREAGQLQVGDGGYQMTGPLKVGQLLGVRADAQAQLDQLTAEAKRVVCLLALLGEPASAALIADASGVSSQALDGVLDRLVERGYLVRVASEHRLRDQMMQLVIDASLPQLERRRLHEQVALALQHTYDPTQPDPARLKQLAQHFAAAGQHWQAVEYLIRSADLTAADGSVEAAVEYYRSILSETHAVSEARERARLTLEIQDRIGDALLWSGSLAEAQIAFELAAENSASDQRRAELQIKLGVTGARRGNPRRVLQISRAILKQADMTEETRASAEALVSLALAAHGSVQEAREHAERSVALASESVPPATLGLARFAAGRAHLLGGDLQAAEREFQLSVAACEDVGDHAGAAESRLQLGLVQNLLGELVQADESVSSALAQRGRTVVTATSVARPQPHRSRWRDRWTLASAALVLGRLRLDRGDVARARRHLSNALRSAESIAAREMALEARVELAVVEVSLARSTGSEASLDAATGELRSVLDAALALELRPLACRARIVLGSMLCARGAVEPSNPAYVREAALSARDALVQARALGLKLHAASARRVLATALAQLGYWPRSAHEFESLVTDLEQYGAKVDLVWTLLAFAEAEISYADSPHAHEVRSRRARAAHLAQEIGLLHDRQSTPRAESAAGA